MSRLVQSAMLEDQNGPGLEVDMPCFSGKAQYVAVRRGR